MVLDLHILFGIIYIALALHKKWSFPLGIFSVNVTKSVGNWGIPKLILIAYKKYLLLGINTFTKPLLFRMKYIIDGVAYLMIHIYNYLLPIYLLLNSFYYFLLAIKLLIFAPFLNLKGVCNFTKNDFFAGNFRGFCQTVSKFIWTPIIYKIS